MDDIQKQMEELASNANKFAEQATGKKKPRPFMLDASVLEHQEIHNIQRDDIRLNRVVFKFPNGLNDEIDLFKRCRMLFAADDYELCYETVLEMLEHHTVEVWLREYTTDKLVKFTEFHITNKDVNLSVYPVLSDYPVIINWLIEFIVAMEEKKYPLRLSTDESRIDAADSKQKKRKKQKQVTTL